MSGANRIKRIKEVCMHRHLNRLRHVLLTQSNEVIEHYTEYFRHNKRAIKIIDNEIQTRKIA